MLKIELRKIINFFLNKNLKSILKMNEWIKKSLTSSEGRLIGLVHYQSAASGSMEKIKIGFSSCVIFAFNYAFNINIWYC